MTPKPIYVVDLIKEVVSCVETTLLPSLQEFDANIQNINYVPGTFEEINEILTLMQQQPDKELKRFPLFALLMSFPENMAQQLGANVADLNIIIARRSNNTDKTPARYENNFKPVLYPIYLEFLNQLYLSPKFETEAPHSIPHIKIDWPYYDGSKEENPLGSYIDAIQIKIKLKLLLKKC